MSTKNKEMEVFLKISVYLTGFNEVELLGTGMLETYYKTIIENNDSATIDFFFTEAARILKEGNEKRINDEILSCLMPDSSYKGLAKNIITMWYTGNWNNTVISSDSYVQGLIWTIAEAHPPGAKQPGYGSWNQPPFQNSIK